MWGLLLNRYVGGGILVATILGAVFFAGDHYGFNARHYAACKSETARRNAAVDKVIAEANHLTGDLGGKASTTQMGDAIAAAV